MTMKNPPHPGFSVKHTCIEPAGLTIAAAARHLGVSRHRLSKVVNGRASITPDLAIRLDQAFGGGAEIWCRMQVAYDFSRARKRIGKIKVERLRVPRRDGREASAARAR